MQNKNIAGIGCFANPATLNRVFTKIVRKYTLGQIEETKLINEYKARGTDGCILLAALIAGEDECFRSIDPKSSDLLENKKITGFFITHRAQKLKLMIFVKGNCSRQERYTASLDEFTKIRQKRIS